MNRDELGRRIEKNMLAGGLEIQEVRLQEDPYRGWRIAVVSTDFSGLPRSERQKITLAEIDDAVIQWAELLTPDERKWSGDLFLDADLEELPAWPEALAKQGRDVKVCFASDLDEDLDRPIVATFYSLRGGVGRSTALAYVSRILASSGKSVLCVDMDLEAPGLATLMGKEDCLRPEMGLVPILLELDQGGTPDIVQHIVRISESDELYCLPAGIPSADYARRLRLLDPEAWYREESNPLRQLVDQFALLPFHPDVVLLDARTGMTPLSAPLLFDLCDLALITFFPHPQARIGTSALVRALLNAKSRRIVAGKQLTPEPRFIISMVPDSKVPEVVQRYQRRALDWIAEWLSPLSEVRNSDAPPVEPSDISHIVPYRELVATSDRILPDKDVWQSYYPIADWLERFLPTKSEARTSQSIGNMKGEILEALEFSAGTAEKQHFFLESFVRTDLVQRAMSQAMPLVLGRKGTGKTAVFRRMLQGSEYICTAVMSPSAFRSECPWVLSVDGFSSIDRTLRESESGWREFWSIYTPLAVWLSTWQDSQLSFPRSPLTQYVERLTTMGVPDELSLVRCLQEMFTAPDIGLLSWDWLSVLDGELAAERYLIFDGLDTGFGTGPAERKRRAEAIQGLFSYLMDRESALKNLRFKILLREDIWRGVRFENKSHLYGRSVRLEWHSQSDYAKTLLKQACRVKKFADLSQSVSQKPVDQLDDWPAEAVFDSWNLLVGERMKGGKTAYTRNWVWNRLADGNGDHSPRALFQLFREATTWERQEQRDNAYEKSVVRPRALIQSLPRVSEEAIQALQEEFTELTDLVTKLREIGRSPLDADELREVDGVALAREVGLLEVYEGTEEEVRRYRVPDLYRIAIGMTRKGQA
jgi:cellulose biosynthesis protein BcsQ